VQNFPDNTIYELDNLDVLRGMNSETVDLIATDPPFNTKRNRAGSAGFYVDNWKWGDTGILPDQWKWNEVHPKWLEAVKDDNPAVHQAIESARMCHDDGLAAYLCFMSVRLLEMHRILKPAGSLFLHCDPTASHYLKIVMDAIFRRKNFRNEIVWKRNTANNSVRKKYGAIADYLLFYTKGDRYTWNQQYGERSESAQNEYRHTDNDGRLYRTHDLTAPGRDPARMFRWQGTIPYRNWAHSRETLEAMLSRGVIWLRDDGTVSASRGHKIYLDESAGAKLQSIWTDIEKTGTSKGRTGSPDEKPCPLYERIIAGSSNENDLVLDPFCGCATTLIAARNLKRRWVGIDRRKDARWHVVTRLAGMDKKERERLENFAIDPGWLGKQMAQYEAHYQKTPPVRTDEGATASSPLEHVFPVTEEHTLRHKDMLKILADKFGVKCWGCGFAPPDDRYLHLDHITPKSEGGSNDLDNRALLCGPCNNKKSNKLTLTGLWKANKKDGHMREPNPIDLAAAQRWTRQELLTRIRTANHQLNLEGR